MLIGDFFTIDQVTEKEDEPLFLTSLNSNHEIYKGHFPGDPICPGVCNIQTIRECAEKIIGKKLKINTISHCKFAALITPDKTPRLLISIRLTPKDDETCTITSSITSPDASALYLEYKGEYTIERTN